MQVIQVRDTSQQLEGRVQLPFEDWYYQGSGTISRELHCQCSKRLENDVEDGNSDVTSSFEYIHCYTNGITSVHSTHTKKCNYCLNFKP